ncbi:MAG TPA: T9SS type A sorting domain-containing protein [Ferruginibacter sp.]|nr:T9SS type A sorting domain-containing protein [Ferruginibacter sp.]
MKRKSIFSLALLLSLFINLQAAPPTVPASGLTFPAANLDGNRFSMTFNKGNGAFRIIVVKAGSAVSSLPVNGVDYAANSSYGTAGTEFAPGDGYVIFKGSNGSSSVSQLVTNLQAGTTYFVSIFEFNGSGVATEYLMLPLSGNVSTKTAPTTQAVISSFTAITGNKVTINWSNGNGDRRLVIARKGAAVNATPVNLTDYSASALFGSGTVLNGDNYAVYKGTGSTVTVTGLDPNTTYHFAVFEYNGNQGPVYLAPGATGSQATNAGPTQASGAISFSNIEGNRLTTSFAPGNGRYQLIIARQGQPVTAVPVNGQQYTANTAFGSGQQIAPGEYVVNSLNVDRTFTNLLPATTYYFKVYDFDMDANGNTYYLTSASSQNNGSTAVAPTLQASNVRFENITGSSVGIRHDPGNGALRLVVMKQGSPVDAIPADLTKYSGNALFGQGAQITPGNYVITGGQNGTLITATGLTPGVTYHVAVFGYNGNNFPVYAIPGATGSITIPNEPTTAASNMTFTLQQGNAFRAQWTGGDGSRRMVIARKNAAVTALPVDGVTYTASNTIGNGTEIAPGQFVVCDDVNRLVDLQNLEIGSTYHLAVFEYNNTGAGPDYLVSSFLASSNTTLTAPTVQASALFASNIQNTQATSNFTIGNGSGRMLIMRAGSPVNIEPQDLVNYSYSQTYGVIEIGSGNYVVLKTSASSSATISGLSPNTQYYVAAFEYNGSTGPVYLRPAATFNFTTTGSGVTPPTTNASAALFSLIDGNKYSFSWSNGDGAKRMVVMRQGNPVSFVPANGTEYTANAAFGAGTDLGSGQYVVFNGTQNTVSVTNLQPASTYHFTVYEFNGSAGTATYLSSGALTASQATATAPAAGSTALSGTAGNLSININWTSGPGAGRIVVMKEGSAVSGLPADLSKYPANSVFQSGSQIAAGEYVLYAGSGNNVTVTGLQANKTYHYSVFEYNGIDAPVYNRVNIASTSTFVSTTLPLTWRYVSATPGTNGVVVKWGTAQEINVGLFIVERSTDNVNFELVRKVTPAGNPVQNNYSITDPFRPTATIYYRIRQIDLDRSFTYSPVIRVNPNDPQAMPKLYPVPATDHTNIVLPKGMEKAGISICDASGRLVKTKQVVNGERISLNGLTPGIYQVLITGNDKKFTVPLLIK